MKILFLDIDGVVNSAQFMKSEYKRLGKGSLLGIDPKLAQHVKRIVAETKCDIVLSSTWRLSERGREDVKRNIGKFIDVTPRSSSGFRGEEIEQWIKTHLRGQSFKYAILDDSSDFYDYQPLFKTDWETGINIGIANRVIKHLNK